MLKGVMAEESVKANICFWVFIEYVDNCHESVELQGIYLISKI